MEETIMRSKGIPESIKEKVNETVSRFNEESIRDANRFYAIRYRGSYLYLDRHDYGTVGPVCRLKFNGKMDNWDFAIFKYSSERYDPEEWFFPGSELVDGTIEGAMKAGLEAYP
jgi:hypothetical protein